MRPALLRRCHQLLSTTLYRPRSGPLSSFWFSTIHHGFARRSRLSTHNLHQNDTLLPSDDTIFALSSAPGRAAIAIIRVSGPACVEIYNTLCPSKPLPKPRYAAVRTLYAPPEESTILALVEDVTKENDHKSGGTEILDPEALILYFPAPKTVTGEDTLELHIHGGPATVKAVLGAIPKCLPPRALPQRSEMPIEERAVRYAEAGEFTKRAFMNNRLDLTQVEALGDVLAADTEQQRKLSVRGTTGTLAKSYETWRKQLLYARGELEALIDFSEDQHFDESPAVLAQSVARQVKVLVDNLEKHVSNAVRGELLRDGISIALLGAPNAGKSSLLNRIVGREAAIVSREAGTTRDVVEIGLDLGGYLCRIGDMAGLRTNNVNGKEGEEGQIGIVEEEGIKRARTRALESDLVIAVLNIEKDPSGKVGIALDREVSKTAEQCLVAGIQIVVVVNKCDLVNSDSTGTWCSRAESETAKAMRDKIRGTVLEYVPTWFVSCKEDQGIKTMLDGLTDTFANMTRALSPKGEEADANVWQESLGASERHRLLLQECLDHLRRFLGEVPATSTRGPSSMHVHVEAASRAEDKYVLSQEDGGADAEQDVDVVLAAESLRAAADCLARITGRGVAGDVEEVLGVVFEKFCVGK
ncbi:P-loop containing nucleoside triphosphate hydrolase protein [Venturia nashicola]|uniref:P-loop containing nucleoside triphosphate hydrolase protein n=1 Tax=Venturia nashicola TaxID=86259 RepID=A0A4Z1NWP3_9PEZI|nr:P-loop containing nucleoside triphosphate hydrolase protein [Venturia nashicola]